MLEEQLNELNIYALRNLARSTGVVSPTSKKKDELIKNIIEIVSSGKKPEQAKTRQGRPPKTYGYEIMDVFNLNNKPQNTLNQAEKEYTAQDVITVVGCVEIGNNGSAILWVEINNKYDNYFISSSLIEKYNILTGDKLVAEVYFDENQKTVKEVFNINGCPVLQLSKERKNYNDIEHNIPTRVLNFDNAEYGQLNLKIGENAYFYGKNNNANTTAIVDILNSSKIENKLYINISLAEKNKLFIKALKNVEKFTAFITDNVDYVRRLVAMAIERAKRILEMGEDVLLVIDDMLSITGIDKEELNLTNNIVSLTKEASPNGSITTFAVIPNDNLTQIEKLADVRFKIVENNIFKL